jgi:hypothetical protein
MNVNFAFDSREELTLAVLDDFNNTSIGRTTSAEVNSGSDLNMFSLSMFSKENVLARAGEELVNKVPLIYYVDLKGKKSFIIKLGTDNVYKSASEELFEGLGHFGSRAKLYDQNEEE